MKKNQRAVQLSANDFGGHLHGLHLTTLDRADVELVPAIAFCDALAGAALEHTKAERSNEPGAPRRGRGSQN